MSIIIVYHLYRQLVLKYESCRKGIKAVERLSGENMTYSAAIRNGFKLINKNWQLVLIQLGMMILSCIMFFVFVGIPLAIAFIIFGIDLVELSRLRDFFGAIKSPSDIISRHTGLVLVFLASILFYLLLVLSIGLYVFGGTVGLIGKIIKENTVRFNMKTFFSEGKRLFFPLLGFTAMIGLIFLGAAFILGIFGGSIAAIMSFAKDREATIVLFLSIFFSLLLFCIGIAFIICIIALALYGIASIVFKGSRAINAIKETIKYLYRNPDSLWLYCIVLGVYIFISFLLILFGTPLNLIPIIGTILAIPYQLFSSIVQSYLGLVILATIFIYYYSKESSAADAGKDTTGEGSIQESDTSLPEASVPMPLPPQMDEQK